MADDRGETGAFCEQCQTVQPVTETVPWQPNLCAVCGADVGGDADVGAGVEMDADG